MNLQKYSTCDYVVYLAKILAKNCLKIKRFVNHTWIKIQMQLQLRKDTDFCKEFLCSKVTSYNCPLSCRTPDIQKILRIFVKSNMVVICQRKIKVRILFSKKILTASTSWLLSISRITSVDVYVNHFFNHIIWVEKYGKLSIPEFARVGKKEGYVGAFQMSGS